MRTKKSILVTIILAALLFGSCNSPKGDYNMNLTLDVSVESILKALSYYSTNEIFLTSLARAKELQKQSKDDFIILFERAFEEIGPNQKLSAIFQLAPEMREQKINFNSTNEEVIAVLRNEVPKVINIAAAILKTRIQYYGLSKNIKKFEINDNRIHLEISGIDNPERFKKLLTASSKLEFWETYENSEIIGALNTADKLLRAMQVNKEKTGFVKTKTADQKTSAGTTTITDQELFELIKKDTTTALPSSGEKLALQNPLWSILSPRVDNQGQPFPSCMVGLAKGIDTAKVNSYLKMRQIKALFPPSCRFYWSRNPHKYDPSKSLYELHAIKITTRDGNPILSGNVITSAKASSNKQSSIVKINLTMQREGAKIWARITRDNIGHCIAIVVDDYVRAYPKIMTQIGGGKTQITGDFTIEEAEDLAIILKSGKLPAEIKIVEEQITQGK